MEYWQRKVGFLADRKNWQPLDIVSISTCEAFVGRLKLQLGESGCFGFGVWVLRHRFQESEPRVVSKGESVSSAKP